MGIFDIFKGKSPPRPAEKPRSADKETARYADAIYKRAQNYDRQEAIEVLSKKHTTDAAAGLLKRFTFVIEPSITDQEEKETAFRGVVGTGKEALPAIREFCIKAESVTWPLRMMREILENDEAYVTEVLALLEKWDTEYDRNADPKVQLVSTLEEVKDARIRPAIERFLDDVNEPTRFHAVTTLLAQGDAAAAGPLARAMAKEEAVRTINRIAEGLATKEWAIPEGDRAGVAERLPRGYKLDAEGIVRRR